LLADIVKLSDEDLAWFAEPAKSMRYTPLLALGPKLIVVTRGADGADAWTADFHLHVPAIRVTVADTVGAGIR
jgi:fructokinase